MSLAVETRQSPFMNRTLGVVILAPAPFRIFPPSRHLDNEAFARSASAFRHLLEDEQVSVFSSPVVLDLFDAEDDPTALIRRIKKFIQNEPALTDVLFYYCGHGDFLPDHHYYVTLKETEPENEAFTGLPVRQMRHALEPSWRSSACFWCLTAVSPEAPRKSG